MQDNKTYWYSGPSIINRSLSTEATLSNVATIVCRCYYESIYFSLSPKATSLMWPQFLGKQGGFIREGLLYNVAVCIEVNADISSGNRHVYNILYGKPSTSADYVCFPNKTKNTDCKLINAVAYTQLLGKKTIFQILNSLSSH